MAETTKLRQLTDGVSTVGAVWLALTIAGLATLLPVEISQALMAILTLALYSVLLAGYALAVGPGQRSSFPVFAIGGVLYPVYVVALLVELEQFRPAQWYSNALITLGAGISGGFQVRGGADTPIESYLLPWLLNFLIPIVVVLAGRAVLRERALRDSPG